MIPFRNQEKVQEFLSRPRVRLLVVMVMLVAIFLCLDSPEAPFIYGNL
jgi:hypothetical protein